jgi:hypothetical protein
MNAMHKYLEKRLWSSGSKNGVRMWCNSITWEIEKGSADVSAV